MAKTDTERLLELKKEIDRAKQDKARTEGALRQNLQRLEKEFGVRGLEAAKKKLADLKEKKENLLDRITEATRKLEESYEW